MDTDLLGGRDEFDHLLQGARSMLVQSNLDQRRSGVVNKGITLLIVGVFKKLLAQIVAERI
jgi:hypothetical protein